MPRRVSLPGAAELFRQTQQRIDRPDHPWSEDGIGDQQPFMSDPGHPAGSADGDEPRDSGASSASTQRGEDEHADAGGMDTADDGTYRGGADDAADGTYRGGADDTADGTPDRTDEPADPDKPTAEPVAADKPEAAQPVHPEGDVADAASDTGRSSQVQPSPDAHDPGNEAPRGRRTGGSGRVKHDEKITVYVSNDELLSLEQARLALRADHGMAVDRGRIVREALALVLGDLADNGADSQLVHRLSRP